MNRIQQYGLLLTCLFACACGNAGKAIQQSSNKPASIAQTGLTQRTTKDFIKMVKTPTTPIELVQNIKLAFDKNLLRQDEFYTEQSMKHFFGAKRVKIDKKGGFFYLSEFHFPAEIYVMGGMNQPENRLFIRLDNALPPEAAEYPPDSPPILATLDPPGDLMLDDLAKQFAHLWQCKKISDSYSRERYDYEEVQPDGRKIHANFTFTVWGTLYRAFFWEDA